MIIWAGGEDIDFPGYVGIVDLSNYRSGYARCGLTPDFHFIQSLPFPGGAVTSAWISAQMTNGAYVSTQQLWGISKTGTLCGLYVTIGPGGKFQIDKYDGTTFTTVGAESGTSLVGAGTLLRKVDVHITSFGATANLTCYVDGLLVLTLTGVDVTLTGFTSFDCVALLGNHSNGATVSEIIVSTTDTRAMSLVTLAPNAAGDANAWTGAYTDIDETTNSDADVLYTNATAQDALFNLTALPAGTFTIPGAVVSARVGASSGAAATGVKLGVKSGGTVGVGVTQTAAVASWGTLMRLMATNPGTGSAWAAADIAALQLALRSA